MADKHIYETLREMIENEIDTITKKGALDEKSLMCLDKLVDIRKDLMEIEGGNADSGQSYIGGNRNSYGSSRSYGNSGNYQRYGGSYRGGNSYRGYSRDGGDMIDRLEEMMDQATTEREREAIRRCMESM